MQRENTEYVFFVCNFTVVRTHCVLFPGYITDTCAECGEVRWGELKDHPLWTLEQWHARALRCRCI